MLGIAYFIVIVFGIAGGILLRKHGISVLWILLAVLLIGSGAALIALPLVFGSGFLAFDAILERSRALPVMMLLSVLSMLWFWAMAAKRR